MLKYLFLILPIIGFAQDAVRVEYEVRQEFDRSNIKQTSARMEEMLVNSENKRYYFELFVNKTNSPVAVRAAVRGAGGEVNVNAKLNTRATSRERVVNSRDARPVERRKEAATAPAVRANRK